MEVGEVRVAEDKDFELLKIYLNRNDGWKLEYDKNSIAVWTRTPVVTNGKDENSSSRSSPSDFKMIRVSEWTIPRNLYNKNDVYNSDLNLFRKKPEYCQCPMV